MKLAYVTALDSLNVRSWSGTFYYTAKSLIEQGISVERIGPLKDRFLSLLRGKKLLYNYVFGKGYLRSRGPTVVKGYASQVSKKLAALDGIDIVLSPQTVYIAYLECKQPMVVWSDATFASQVDFYPRLHNLCRASIVSGNTIEKIALDKCRLAIYSSDWAARSAIEDYHIDPAKVKVVPFGANIECDRTPGDVNRLIESRPSSKCKLLFLGIHWYRKGGDVAIEVAKRLNESGLDTELTIVGCKPIIDGPLPKFARALGFISKSTEEGRRRLDQLFAESHFLIVPSTAECYGVVFCEANSFGVPCISRSVGGIPTIIKDGLNGRTFPLDADIDEYCSYICSLFSDYAKYKQLAISSFSEYQSRLNWSVAAKAVKELLQEIVGE